MLRFVTDDAIADADLTIFQLPEICRRGTAGTTAA
jgi:hypothetical protein